MKLEIQNPHDLIDLVYLTAEGDGVLVVEVCLTTPQPRVSEANYGRLTVADGEKFAVVTALSFVEGGTQITYSQDGAIITATFARSSNATLIYDKNAPPMTEDAMIKLWGMCRGLLDELSIAAPKDTSNFEKPLRQFLLGAGNLVGWAKKEEVL